MKNKLFILALAIVAQGATIFGASQGPVKTSPDAYVKDIDGYLDTLTLISTTIDDVDNAIEHKNREEMEFSFHSGSELFEQLLRQLTSINDAYERLQRSGARANVTGSVGAAIAKKVGMPYKQWLEGQRNALLDIKREFDSSHSYAMKNQYEDAAASQKKLKEKLKRAGMMVGEEKRRVAEAAREEQVYQARLRGAGEIISEQQHMLQAGEQGRQVLQRRMERQNAAFADLQRELEAAKAVANRPSATTVDQYKRVVDDLNTRLQDAGRRANEMMLQNNINNNALMARIRELQEENEKLRSLSKRPPQLYTEFSGQGGRRPAGSLGEPFAGSGGFTPPPSSSRRGSEASSQAEEL